MKPPLLALSRDELRAWLAARGEPVYRADQLLAWLYGRRASDWEAMTNLPRALRARLAEAFDLRPLELVTTRGAADATLKFLWRLPADGALIESVLIPANPALYGEPSDRHTLCVSTQVGCAYGCRFCASGLDGWKRNLTPDEIVGQVLAVEHWHAARAKPETAPAAGPAVAAPPARPADRLVTNLVIMGMGEPLANYEHLLKALRLLNASWGGGIGARKITISTSGLVPQIRRLADEPEQFHLAISLHGATDAVRSRLMPVNRRYPLRELLAACADYQQRKGRMLTFEYILLAGVNDSTADARALVRLTRPLDAKVNLIPYNRVEALPWERPDDAVCATFLAVLQNGGVRATLRREKGGDVEAACGQLRLQQERTASRS